MDSSGKPLVYGKLYQVERKETGYIVTIEPTPFLHKGHYEQWLTITADSTRRLFWTWDWTLACFPPHSWHWHDMAEILNESE